jgi:hypothetical protein
VSVRVAFVAVFLSFASALYGQQPEAPRAQSGTRAPEPPIVIYRIDLDPTGSTFAMNEPVLDGDMYVYRSLPEREITRIPKARVKETTRKSTDIEKLVVWQVDVLPSGSYLTRDEPVKKGKNWFAHAWKQGQLASVPQADVKKITRLTGFDAFRAQQIALGVVVLEGESTTPGFKPGGAAASGAPASSAPAPQTGNWTYEGKPGVTDAYAPGSGTVSRPGDTPMAPTASPR